MRFSRLRTWVVAMVVGASFAVGVSGCSGVFGGKNSNDSGDNTGGDTVGQIDGVETALPPLPKMVNVVGHVREDSVGIDFDPVDGALDYRVYPLPSDQDVSANADGSVTVKNAIYRCAGIRQGFDLENNLNTNDPTLLASNAPYNWKAKIPDNPTLGYVYATSASDRVPVYAVAGAQDIIDQTWRESRLKVYTTDIKVRQSWLDKNWRDDGIVFYVPATASASTHTIYSSQLIQGTSTVQSYLTDADLSAHASDPTPPTPAFQVLNAAEGDTQPLMTVTYDEIEGDVHDELAVGKERFQRAAYQGNGPLWHVEWAGVTETTTLVVEALDSGCPYQGFLSPQHLDAPPHQTFLTLDELQKASPTGEVFINGEHDGTTFPKAIARSFVRVGSRAHNSADWDWYQGFNVGSDFGPVTPVPYPDCANSATNTTCGRWQSPIFDIAAFSIDNPNNVMVYTYGQFLGQFWSSFDDWKQDVTGKIRYTALQKATVGADPATFLHVTWSTDIVGTGRRYPQMIVSDQDAPVQSGFSNPNQNSILVQTIQGPTMRLEAQVIHGLVGSIGWDVNNQAPSHIFLGDTQDTTVRPVEPLFEHAGMDRMTKFDAYVSSNRLYVFLDDTPAGCTQYPTGFALSGPVTVTFGDVMYHEGAPDELICVQNKPYTFMHEHECNETRRRFDDLGFKSGVAAPAWDETKLPCGDY